MIILVEHPDIIYNPPKPLRVIGCKAPTIDLASKVTHRDEMGAKNIWERGNNQRGGRKNPSLCQDLRADVLPLMIEIGASPSGVLQL
jgi:hypothetical protein